MYSRKYTRGELVTLTAIGLALLSAVVSFAIKAGKQAYDEHQAQKAIEMEHRDISFKNGTRFPVTITGDSHIKDIEIPARGSYDVPNFIEDDIKFGTSLRLEFVVHVSDGINDGVNFRHIERNVTRVCRAPFKESIQFTIFQKRTSAPDEYDFGCQASELH